MLPVPGYFYKEVTPLFLAAEKGHIKMVELFVKYKNYIDNVDFQYNGRLTALDIATMNGHNDIVKLLMPLMNDAQEQKQIQNFVETTSSDQSLAKTYLSRHNWDINAAVQSFFEDNTVS